MKLGMVDESRITEFYAALEAMQVQLDPDPVAMGPGALQSKLHLLRNHLNRWERIYEDLSQEIQIVRRRLRVVTGEYDILEQRALTSDPEVRSRPNLKDRKAVFATKNPTLVRNIQDLRASVEDLEEFKAVLEVKKKDLMDISSRIKDQIALCKEEIQLGRRWGYSSTRESLPPPTTRDGMPIATSKDLVDMEALVGSVDQMFDQADTEGTTKDLSAVTHAVVTSVAIDEDSLDSLLENFEVPDNSAVVSEAPMVEMNLDDLLS